jgi:hypothetical protein
MIKKLIDRLVGRDETPPEPLKPGQAIDGSFDVKMRRNGARYDLAKALQRSQQVIEARKRLGLDEEEEVRLPEDYLRGPVPKVVQAADYQPPHELPSTVSGTGYLPPQQSSQAAPGSDNALQPPKFYSSSVSGHSAYPLPDSAGGDYNSRATS